MRAAFTTGLGWALGLSLLASAAFADCPGVSQLEMNECAAADHDKADAELTALYAKFKPVTPEMRAAERAWIAYRDAECAYEGHESIGGSIHPMEVAMCQTARTRERIAVLKSDLGDDAK
jgi:uncharacterized protein YecT (DUF1311 family)